MATKVEMILEFAKKSVRGVRCAVRGVRRAVRGVRRAGQYAVRVQSVE